MRAINFIFGTANQTERGIVKRYDDWVYEVETPYEIMTSSSETKSMKIIRVQIMCATGTRPKDVVFHCDLINTHSQQNYAVAPCNITFHNRIDLPIHNPSSSFKVFFTDAYGLPVQVYAFTVYTNINY
jgi:hypothetical protein